MVPVCVATSFRQKGINKDYIVETTCCQGVSRCDGDEVVECVACRPACTPLCGYGRER